MIDPRLSLHVHEIELYIRENSGYGDGYSEEPIIIKNVYFEKNTRLDRVSDDEERANAWFSVFKKIEIKKGDMIKYENDYYIITDIEEFKKPKTNVFEHMECQLRQSAGEQNND
jgi:hypothetical protein